MSSLFRYIEACGSLSPSEAMLSGADFLLLSQLAYADFPESAATFGDALEGALLLPPIPLRFGFEHKNDRRLIAETAKSRRFSALAFLGFREKFDAEGACQFAALALQWDEETAIVAFRGTDQSFAGWKENFMLAYRSPVPAQALAVSFVAEIAERFHGSLILCGHSKGGNLAVYAAAFSEAPVRRRVREVVSLDGPGLSPADARRAEFLEIRARVRVYIPRASLVGLLFENPPGSVYIRSRAPALQHYPYMWRIEGCDFVPVGAPTRFNAYLARTLRRFVCGMPPEMREAYVEALFKVVSSAESESVPEMLKVWRKSVPRVLGATLGIDRETRRLFRRVFWIFLRAASGRMT